MFSPRNPSRTFLHFFNRELYRYQNKTVSIQDQKLGLVLADIFTTGALFSTYSYVFEQDQIDEETLELARDRIESGRLFLVSDSQTQVEHIERRKEIYRNDNSRYPFYFREELNREALDPNFSIDNSASAALSGALIKLFSSNESVIELPISVADRQYILQQRPDILQLLLSNTELGQTISILTDETIDARLKRIFGTLLSSAHIKFYQQETQSSIITGFSQIEEYDILSENQIPIDFRILKELAILLFGTEILYDIQYMDELSKEIFNSPFRNTLLDEIHLFFTTCLEVTRLNGGKFLRIKESNSQYILNEFVKNAIDLVQKSIDEVSPKKYCDEPVEWINRLGNLESLSNKNPFFENVRKVMSEVYDINSATRGNVLVVCVTETEAKVALQVFGREFGEPTDPKFMKDVSYWEFGFVSGSNVTLALLEMGDEGESAISLMLGDFLRTNSFSQVIMGGICFGLRSDKTALGDVFFSSAVRNYNLRKITTSSEGLKEVIPRGDRIQSDSTLRNRFRTGAITSSFSFKFKSAIYLSGSALSDHPDFIKELLDVEPEALVGEMEGAGLFAICTRHNTPWIIVKGICDWGMGKTDDYQKKAAENSFLAIARVLSQGIV